MSRKLLKTSFLKSSTTKAILATGWMSFLMHPTVFGGYKLPDLGILAWIHLVPLFLVLPKHSTKKQFGISFLALLLGYTGHLYWLYIAMREYGGLGIFEGTLALIALAAILAVYKSIFIILIFWLNRISRISLVVLVPVILTLYDFVLHQYPFGGFPWVLPAYSQGQWLSVFQWISITGAFGLSFLIYLVNALIFEGWHFFVREKEFDKGVSRFVIVFVFGLMSLFMSFLASESFEKNKNEHGEIQIALIQANISQDQKWSRQNLRKNLLLHERLTVEAARDGAEIVLWPESAYPFRLYQESLKSDTFLDNYRMPAELFIGAVITKRIGRTKTLYNSVLHINRKAQFVNQYNKMHLVPFGEYVPMKNWLTFIEKMTQAVGSFTPGEKPILFDVNGFRFGSLICYEDVFLDIARKMAKEGAQVLVNYTNDAWYKNSSAQYQHLVMSQFRALENRKPLIRATNTGYTAVINAKGEIIDDIPPFEQRYLLHRLEVTEQQSFFTKHGFQWLWGLGVVAVLILIYALFIKNFISHKKE